MLSDERAMCCPARASKSWINVEEHHQTRYDDQQTVEKDQSTRDEARLLVKFQSIPIPRWKVDMQIRSEERFERVNVAALEALPATAEI